MGVLLSSQTWRVNSFVYLIVGPCCPCPLSSLQLVTGDGGGHCGHWPVTGPRPDPRPVTSHQGLPGLAPSVANNYLSSLIGVQKNDDISVMSGKIEGENPSVT